MTKEEFVSLLPADDPIRAEQKRFFGNFGISTKVHMQQINRGLQVGDAVFYLKISPTGPINQGQGVPECNVVLTQDIITQSEFEQYDENAYKNDDGGNLGEED
jgi:hypothetical protein